MVLSAYLVETPQGAELRMRLSVRLGLGAHVQGSAAHWPGLRGPLVYLHFLLSTPHTNGTLSNLRVG